jgi:hypothetical protein
LSAGDAGDPQGPLSCPKKVRHQDCRTV